MLWRHILGYLPVNAIQGIVSVVTIVVLTRLLDPEAYGRYALVLATTQLVAMGCFTWLHASMARFFETAKREGSLPEHFATAYSACAVVAVLVVLVYAGIVLSMDLSVTIQAALLVGLLMLVLRAFLMVGLETHRAARQVGIFGTLETIQAVGGLILGVVLIVATPLGEVGPFLGAAIATLICLAIDIPRMVAFGPFGAPRKQELRRFAEYGLPVSAILALSLVLAVSDRFLIGAMLGEAEVGIYSAGYQIASRVPDLLFTWLGMAAMPLLIAAYERDGVAAACAIARRNLETLVFLGFPAAAGLALVAEPLAAVMLGEQFRQPAAAIVPWVAVAALMLGFTAHYVHHAFVVARRTGVMAGLMIVPAVTNVGLNLLLIPRLGLQGAVMATVASYAVALILCTIVGMRYFPLPLPGHVFLKGIVATAGMAVAVAAMPAEANAAGLMAKIAVGVASYIPLALMLDLAGSRSWARALSRRVMVRSSSG